MQAAAATARPRPLTTTEKAWAALLAVVGVGLIVALLVWYARSTPGGGLKSKVTTVTKSGATTTTTTTEYADTVVIFALTLGAALTLSAAFFGRLRALKLGALSLGLGELPPEKEEELRRRVTAIVDQQMRDPEQRRVATAAAQSLALERVRDDYWGVVPSPPDEYLDEVAGKATDTVTRAMAPRR